jgi:NADH-quinone oxidoreductase subunit C
VSLLLPPDLEHRLQALPGVQRLARHDGAWWAGGDALDVLAMAALMHELGIRLGTITAVPLGLEGQTRILYHWVALTQFINIDTVTRNGCLPSLAPLVRAADWAEREIHDLFGVRFIGHPNPAPLLKPDGMDSAQLRQALCGPAALQRSPTAGFLKT